MRTLGSTRIQLSLLTILAVSSVTSTVLQISKAISNTSAVNTFGSLESLEVRAGKFALKVTGKDTTALVRNLMPIESLLETTVSDEK
jgi:hypothetical protein|tara:strand:- start:2484 stop:2744 length:261 start_codon:yes stop_codon:yes gene_type:complete